MTTAFEFRHSTYPDNAIHVSLDLETCSLNPNAAILQIGACTELTTFGVNISVDSNEMALRDFNTETLKWWDKQNIELRRKVFSGKVHLQDALKQFIDWCQLHCGGDFSRIVLWSKPQCFDIPILKSAVENFMEWPFNHRNVGDVYTITRCLTEQEQKDVHNATIARYHNLKAHDALDDSLYQLGFIVAGLKLCS